GALRILEIGPGPGYNFEFYPPNSQLTAVEVNRFFEEQFFEKQADHPHIKMDRFVVGFAEDMKDVPDNSVDIVVSTMVLCSVRSVEGALKEVHRVLAPGGKYYYWEHVLDPENIWARLGQHLASYTYYDLLFGCQLNRKSGEIVKANKAGYSHIEHQRFRTPPEKGFEFLSFFHSAHAKGIATK
ncbi:hypothetical protein DAPPUDRAFT_64689, partial [Daphnia pulex]